MTTEDKTDSQGLNRTHIYELARQVMDIEIEGIAAIRDRLDENFLQAVELILACQGKVLWTAMGKSGHIARKIASTMTSTGTPAMFLHPAESSHGDLGFIESRDLVIAVSYSGGSTEILPILGYCSRKNVPLIAITANPESELAKRAKIVLNVKVPREACPLGLAPTASSTATLVMGDALAMAVLDAKGFRTEDFFENHPGGGLGFRLSQVKDLMHAGATMPVLKATTPLRDVFSVLSRGDVRGAAGVVDDSGDLIGVVTDGDIRRRLESSLDPFQGTAGDLMSRNPRTVDASELAEKALFLMEQFRINVLFVLDKAGIHPRQPVGVIHVQDLIRAKVR